MIKRKLILLGIPILIFLISSCNFTNTKAETFSPDKAKNLILKNLFFGQSNFPVKNPHVWQYGSVHIDGPDGGMLYKFETSTVAVEWLLAQWKLKMLPINEASLPQSLVDQPNWWIPEEIKASHYYFLTEELDTGGRKKIMLFVHSSSDTIYLIEDYSDIPGI